MLALVMCLLVLVAAVAMVLHDALGDGTDKGATAPAPTRRAQRTHRHRPLRAGLLLLVSTAGIGVLTGATLGLLGLVLVLALRSISGASP